MMTKAASCAVIGGGLSGLTTTYLLSRLPSSLVSRVSLFESSSEFGGPIKTVCNPASGALQDLGTHSARISGPPSENAFLRLVSSLKLGSEIVWLPPAPRFIYAANGLRPVSVFSPFAEAPFTRSPLGLILRRLFAKGPQPLTRDNDMSVDEFFRTRFDAEFAEYLGSALVRGICGADSRTLSVSAFLPLLVKWDAVGPNIFLGALREMFWARFRSKPVPEVSHLDSVLPRLDEANRPPPKISIMSFRRGMQTLPDVIENHLKEAKIVTLKRNNAISNVKFENNQFQLSFKNAEKKEIFDTVFVCTPASVCGDILEHSGLLSSSTVDLLRPSTARYSSIAVVALECDGDIGTLPFKRGFGHLLPLCEDPEVLGVVYDSSVFSHMDGKVAGRSTLRFTVMLSTQSYWLTPETQAAPFNLAPDLKAMLTEMGMVALRKQLGLKIIRPFHTNVGIWMNAIPCYPVGHPQRLRRLRTEISNKMSYQKLHLVGSAFDGVGVGDCVKSAVNAVGVFKTAFE